MILLVRFLGIAYGDAWDMVFQHQSCCLEHWSDPHGLLSLLGGEENIIIHASAEWTSCRCSAFEGQKRKGGQLTREVMGVNSFPGS